MLDSHFVRENFDLVKKNLEKRQDAKVIANLKTWLEKDKEWRTYHNEVNRLRAERNKMTGQISIAKAQKKPVVDLMIQAKKIPIELAEKEKKSKELELIARKQLMILPNLLLDDVPFGKSGEDNKVIKTWGEIAKCNFAVEHHGQLAVKRNWADFERAVKTSGMGFYTLKGDLALLNLAIVNFAISLLEKKGFQLIIPPGMIKREAYEGVTDLNDFEKVMYKIEGEDLYPIATAEHALVSMHYGESFEEKDLPIKYQGYSMNYRKEIGAHGLDERGLFRLHQFDKVEQIIFCKPEESQEWHEKLLANAEEFVQAMALPYRIVNICTGDIGIVAAKKYDIEVWSPRENKYFETHSISNCSSYQCVRSNIRLKKKDGSKDHPHSLNATMVAVPRMLRAILENHQTSDGKVLIPKALQPFMNGRKEI